MEDGKQQNYRHFNTSDADWKMLMMKSLHDNQIHGITDIVERNYQIAEVTIANNSAPNTVVFTYDPATYWNNIINVANKVTGFLCYHAELEIEIRYNVEPQAVGGIGLVQFYPQAKSATETTNLLGNQTLWSSVATPINLLTETSSKFTIQYLSTSMTYSANSINDPSQAGYWPQFNILVWSPYVSPTNTDLKLTIYGRLRNVTLMIPTILMIKPPDTLSEFSALYDLIRKKQPYKITSSDKAKVLQLIKDITKDDFDAQINADAELQQEKRGIISETVESINTCIQSLPPFPLSKEIQQVAAIATPAIAGIARMFGFSKPENHSISSNVEQLYSQNMNNIDGAVNAYNLANSAHQKKPVGPLGKDMEDHLAFAKFAARPAYINRFSIARTTPANTILFKQDISPYRLQSFVGSSVYPTPLGFTSMFLENWRGDIILRFRFFSNQFINFNVQMGVVYGVDAGSITNATDLSNVYNYIFDGKALTTVDYRIEYKAQNPWKKTGSQLPGPLPTVTSRECVGAFVLRLQNALTSSSSTVESIDVTVEAFAAENYELNVLQHVPWNYNIIEDFSFIETKDSFDAQTEADATAVASDEINVDATIAKEPLDNMPDALIFGQSVKSFKQILNTEQFFGEFNLTSPATTEVGDTIIFFPYAFLRPDDGEFTNLPNRYNYLNLITQPFAFISGELILSFFRFYNSIDASLDQVKYDPQINQYDILGVTPTSPYTDAIYVDSTNPQTSRYLKSLGSNLIIQNTLQSRKVFKVPNFLDRWIYLRPSSDSNLVTLVNENKLPPGAIVYSSITPGKQNPVGTQNLPISVYARGADNFHMHFYNGLTRMWYNEYYYSLTPARLS